MPLTELPTEDTKPTTDVLGRAILLYGGRKIGKTTFASQMPKPLFIATEAGQAHLAVRRVEVTNWTTFQEACTLIKKGNNDGSHDRQTIVIDTIDNLYKFCREHILKINNLAHESDQGFGRGYDLVNGAFFKALNWLALLPQGLLMISHAQEKEVKNRVGGKESRIMPTLPPSAQKIVNGMADFILYADVEEVPPAESGAVMGYRHVLRTKPTTIYEAGMRLLPGQLFPETLPLDYGIFSAALSGALTDDAIEAAYAKWGVVETAVTAEKKTAFTGPRK
jgi:hypothetical protein